MKWASEGCRKRFLEFSIRGIEAIIKQVDNRVKRNVHELSIDDYIKLRRDGSSLHVIWSLVELGLGTDLSDEVIAHPVLESLCIHANNIVSWSNVRPTRKLALLVSFP